uniref:Uncharacterized protein n=1 Tax=Heterorhabditis bacteriophora TaxID=37862 RepID=A0A1I7XPS8_HETBA
MAVSINIILDSIEIVSPSCCDKQPSQAASRNELQEILEPLDESKLTGNGGPQCREQVMDKGSISPWATPRSKAASNRVAQARVAVN